MSKITNQYLPQTVTHPGETLREKLEEMKMGSKEFAIRTGKPEKTISSILNGNSSITSDMAVLFESVLKIPARFWLKQQYFYDEAVSRIKQQEKIKEATVWAKQFPYKEMAAKGWVTEVKSVEERVPELLSFFGTSTPSSWESYFLEKKLNTVFRISLAHSKSAYALSAWIRKGEIDSNNINAPEFSKKELEKRLSELKKVMAEQPKDFFQQIKKICLSAGVKVVYTPCLPKAPTHGATRWINDNPVIQLSCRYKQNDIFWFTFFHEIGHIILHGKKDVFLEKVEYSEKDLIKEKEADDFAIKWTFSEKEEQIFLKSGKINTELIIKMAKNFGTHPALIVGRLHRKKITPRTHFHKLYEKITLE